MKHMKLIKEILLVISIIAIMTIATIMGFNNMKVEMGIIIGLGIPVWFFLTIEKFETFKGAGIEAKLKKAVSEANATVEELRELAVSLAEPTIVLITMSNRPFQYLPISSKIEMKDKVMTSLKNLKISDSQIDKTTSFMDNVFIQDHLNKIKHYLEKKNTEKKALEILEKDFIDFDKTPNKNISSKLFDFLDKEELIDENITAYMEDIDFYIEHKKIRRPDEWQ